MSEGLCFPSRELNQSALKKQSRLYATLIALGIQYLNIELLHFTFTNDLIEKFIYAFLDRSQMGSLRSTDYQAVGFKS